MAAARAHFIDAAVHLRDLRVQSGNLVFKLMDALFIFGNDSLFWGWGFVLTRRPLRAAGLQNQYRGKTCNKIFFHGSSRLSFTPFGKIFKVLAVIEVLRQ